MRLTRREFAERNCRRAAESQAFRSMVVLPESGLTNEKLKLKGMPFAREHRSTKYGHCYFLSRSCRSAESPLETHSLTSFTRNNRYNRLRKTLLRGRITQQSADQTRNRQGTNRAQIPWFVEISPRGVSVRREKHSEWPVFSAGLLVSRIPICATRYASNQADFPFHRQILPRSHESRAPIASREPTPIDRTSFRDSCRPFPRHRFLTPLNP